MESFYGVGCSTGCGRKIKTGCGRKIKNRSPRARSKTVNCSTGSFNYGDTSVHLSEKGAKCSVEV